MDATRAGSSEAVPGGGPGHGPGRGRGEGGMSLVEVLVSISLLSFLMLVILQSTMTVGDSTSAIESFNTVLVTTQKAVDQMHEDIATARKIYEQDATGQSYLDAMDYSTRPRVSSTLLPLILPTGEFEQDLVGDRRTGSALMIAGDMSPYDFTAPSNGKRYRVSIFRLMTWYISDKGSPVANGLTNFDLVRWESTAFADYITLTSITDAAARAQVVADMVANGRINDAWDPSQPVAAAFYKLTTDVAVTPEVGFKIPYSRVTERLPKGYYNLRNGAIAPNNSITGSEAAVPKFAQKVPSGPGFPGFPNGFEVKVIGPSGARKIKVRIVAERSMRSRIYRASNETISTMRDI